jgi:hypothetical protein
LRIFFHDFFATAFLIVWRFGFPALLSDSSVICLFGVNLGRPVIRSVSARLRRFMELIEEVIIAATLGDDPIKLGAFGVLCAALRACSVRRELQ